MNAIELLKEDHQEALRLIDELETVDEDGDADPTDTENFNRLNEALKMHTRIEEEIFYPTMEEFNETRLMVHEAYKEHDQIEQLLAQLSSIAPNREEFQDTLSELRDTIEIHVEEEEGELFLRAEEVLDRNRLNEMGRRMQEMKGGGRTVAASTRRK